VQEMWVLLLEYSRLLFIPGIPTGPLVKDRDESIRERILGNLGWRGIQRMGNIDRGVKIFLI